MEEDKTAQRRSLPLYTRCEPGDTMLITPDRIVLSSAIGRPALREFGALTVYVSRGGGFDLSIEDGRAQSLEFAIVLPHVPHQVATGDLCVTKILIEPETVDIDALHDQLEGSVSRTRATAERMREGFSQLATIPSGDVDVDTMFFGAPLPRRRLDVRIAAVVENLSKDYAEKLSAEDCAAQAGLSFSRFTHVFRTETGNTFRGFRAWKHARSFMPFVNGPYNLSDVALQLGYSDASHFSRSIRQVYGISPKDISEVSRNLRVLLHPGCRSENMHRAVVPVRTARA